MMRPRAAMFLFTPRGAASPLPGKGWTVSLRSLGGWQRIPIFPRFACASWAIPLPANQP